MLVCKFSKNKKKNFCGRALSPVELAERGWRCDFDAFRSVWPDGFAGRQKLDIKWGEDRVYCVGGKMFAHRRTRWVMRQNPAIMFKASDLAFEMLVESGAAVRLRPISARAKWVQLLAADGSLPADDVLAAYVRERPTL